MTANFNLLASEGIICSDPGLNTCPTSAYNPYGQIGLLPSDVNIKGQPTKDGFTSSNKKATVKKIAASAILAGLAVVGVLKLKGGAKKAVEGLKNFSFDTVKNFFKK